jgi:hypothetical protein
VPLRHGSLRKLADDAGTLEAMTAFTRASGPNFSADRKILFANVQVPGYVYAIRGPFKKQRR